MESKWTVFIASIVEAVAWGYCRVVERDFEELLADWGWVTYLKRETEGCAPLIGVSHCSASLRMLIPGCWKGGFKQLFNLRSRRSNVDFILVMEQWTISLPLQGY